MRRFNGCLDVLELAFHHIQSGQYLLLQRPAERYHRDDMGVHSNAIDTHGLLLRTELV
jgi:hypothetical protein